MRPTYFLMAAVLSFGLLGTASTADAQVHDWKSGKSAPLNMKELIPTLKSDEAYTERYTFSAELDGGGDIYIDFTISNLGWGDHHGASVAKVNLPGQRPYRSQQKLDSDEWSYSKSKLALNIGNSTLEGKGEDTFVIKHTGAVPFELEFTNTLPMWQPGRGKVTVDDQSFRLALIAPRANVTGRVKVNGEWREVKGTNSGIGDYNQSNIAPFDLAKRFSRFRAFNGDIFVAWRDIKLTDDLGGRSLTWIVVGYKDKIVFSDASARLKEGKLHHHDDSDYDVPLTVQIDGKRGADTVRLVMRGKRFKATDLLDDYGAPVKLVASAVSNPFQFAIPSTYQLQMTIGGVTANIKGRAEYAMDILND